MYESYNVSFIHDGLKCKMHFETLSIFFGMVLLLLLQEQLADSENWHHFQIYVFFLDRMMTPG